MEDKAKSIKWEDFRLIGNPPILSHGIFKKPALQHRFGFLPAGNGSRSRNPASPKVGVGQQSPNTNFYAPHCSAAAWENESPLSFHALLCLYRISRIFPERTAPKNPAYFSEKLIQEHSKVSNCILSMHILYACAGSQLGHLNPKAFQGRKKSLGLSAWSGRIGAAFTSLTSLIGQKQELVQLGFHPLV